MIDSWQEWTKAWKSAYNCFNSKGNAQTKNRLKTKWLNNFYDLFNRIKGDDNNRTEEVVSINEMVRELEMIKHDVIHVNTEYHELIDGLIRRLNSKQEQKGLQNDNNPKINP